MDNFASGNWVVKPGNEQEFVTRWTSFLRWAADEVPGLVGASLLQDATEPRHFVSFAQWKSLTALEDWRSRPEFAEKIGACRALCDDFRGGNYVRVSAIQLKVRIRAAAHNQVGRSPHPDGCAS